MLLPSDPYSVLRTLDYAAKAPIRQRGADFAGQSRARARKPPWLRCTSMKISPAPRSEWSLPRERCCHLGTACHQRFMPTPSRQTGMCAQHLGSCGPLECSFGSQLQHFQFKKCIQPMRAAVRAAGTAVQASAQCARTAWCLPQLHRECAGKNHTGAPVLSDTIAAHQAWTQGGTKPKQRCGKGLAAAALRKSHARWQSGASCHGCAPPHQRFQGGGAACLHRLGIDVSIWHPIQN